MTESRRIRIQLNGRTREVLPGTTISLLIAELGVAKERVAIERNLEVVPRAQHPTETLAEGDVVEVVTFVGGG